MSNSKAVVLGGTPRVDEQRAAAEAITPGALIEIDGSGDWQNHSTDGQSARAFALERDELGNEISVAYAIGDAVKAGYFAPGDKVNALIASGENLSAGDFLESAGDGTLTAVGSGVVVAMSDEDSGAVTVLTRHAIVVV